MKTPLCAFVIALGLLAGCGGGGTNEHDSVEVRVTPTSASLRTSETQPFTATVQHASDATVTWSVVEEGGGTITTTGLYTAPGTPGVYHVRASSVANPSKSATATVVVSAPLTLQELLEVDPNQSIDFTDITLIRESGDVTYPGVGTVWLSDGQVRMAILIERPPSEIDVVAGTSERVRLQIEGRTFVEEIVEVGVTPHQGNTFVGGTLVPVEDE